MAPALPAVTGMELMRLLEKDGWDKGRETQHGRFFSRSSPGQARPASTVIPATSRSLAPAVLSRILGPKQTGIGRRGLEQLLRRYGRR